MNLPQLTRAASILGSLALLASCKFPEIPLATPEPIKLDPIEVKVRIDLYQHGDSEPSELNEAAETEEIVERQRNRMAEIQELKNSRLVGENHRGLLDIRNLPGGDYGTYVRETVEAENYDRTYLMRQEARRRDVLLPEIQSEQWLRRKELSFEGEWVEAENEQKEGSFTWTQKG